MEMSYGKYRLKLTPENLINEIKSGHFVLGYS